MKTKVGIVSLGCDKNRVDTEVMLAKLVEGGYEITSSPSDADVIIVNTCAFWNRRAKEAIETVLEMSRYKSRGRCQKIIVTGCLGQKYGDELFSALHEADAVVGINDYDAICDIVDKTVNGERGLYQSCNEGITFGEQILTSAPHTAYLKIADGCNNFCTYCLIPYIRGRFRSVDMDTLVSHAEQLVKKGVKELILVAQDTTMYGKDLYGDYKLPELLRRLSAINDLRWIRILYAYPELMTDELIEEIATNAKVVKYVDIPLQHVNDEILKKMNRKSTADGINALFDKLESRRIDVRSTFICGFPGETGKTVAEVATFLKARKLRNVGFFAYSREDGTPSAKFPHQVTERTKNGYVKKLYHVQYKIALELNNAEIGKTLECVIDSWENVTADGYLYKGRTAFMTPEIDGVVYISSKRELTVGEFCDVNITKIRDYDLYGEVE